MHPTPPLLAPNVSDCAEVLSRPSFTVQRGHRIPRLFFPERHEVLRSNGQGFVHKCSVFKWRQFPLVKETYDSAVLSGARTCPEGTWSA